MAQQPQALSPSVPARWLPSAHSSTAQAGYPGPDLALPGYAVPRGRRHAGCEAERDKVMLPGVPLAQAPPLHASRWEGNRLACENRGFVTNISRFLIFSSLCSDLEQN